MRRKKKMTVRVTERANENMWNFSAPTIWHGRAETFLSKAPKRKLFDLVVTSPPYNIGKGYEQNPLELQEYFLAQRKIIEEIVRRLKPSGSICWQVGNFVQDGQIFPLDLEFHKIFRKLGLKLRNRIVWRFGHGLHNARRFSGRYEVILWYTKGDNYVFNLDAVRVPQKYPGKTHYKGNHKSKYSSNPLGKNPTDVWPTDSAGDFWDIPNVKSNHVEKTFHPCQFPVGLVERLVLALTKKNAVVFDPFAGVCSAGVAALIHKRRFIGCEKIARYAKQGERRLKLALYGQIQYRPHDRPIYDHKLSRLSIRPTEVN